jgi:hypothetical protein
MHVVAALVDTPNAVTEHKLYWGAVSSRDEGMYLCAILNCPELTQLVRPLMSYGKDERDVDKHVWKLPIPQYNSGNTTHQQLSNLGHRQAELVAGLDLDEESNYITLRQRVRQELAASSFATGIEEIVLDLLS